MTLDAESLELIGGTPYEAKPIRRLDLGEFHTLLLDACPREPDDVASITKLAGLLGVTKAAIYKWIDKGVLTSRRARQIAELDGARKTVTDFLPYLG